ncbi:hypothetical protein BKA62DRAFT_777481 [Auriculariales sp. MPI-PUGE-AT-0066]|nr:hypothetical protein BKA62DRAFT_777481 [Auriculariales sp. MPI-PUGE-AT-0066]
MLLSASRALPALERRPSSSSVILVLFFLVSLLANVGLASTVSSTFARGVATVDRRAASTTNSAPTTGANYTIDDADAAVSYLCNGQGSCADVWRVDTANPSLHYTSTAESILSVTFTGVQIAMYGSQATKGAAASAYVVHAANSSAACTATRFDTKSSPQIRSTLLYTSPVLPASTYRLVVQFEGVNGQELLAVDRFQVAGTNANDKGFPPAAAAAIGFGCALACVIVLVALFIFLRRRSRAKAAAYNRNGPQATQNGANILSWWDFKTTENRTRHDRRNGQYQTQQQQQPWMTFPSAQLQTNDATVSQQTYNDDVSSPLTPQARVAQLPMGYRPAAGYSAHASPYGATGSSHPGLIGGGALSPGGITAFSGGTGATPGHSGHLHLDGHQLSAHDRTPLSPRQRQQLLAPDTFRQPPTALISPSIYAPATRLRGPSPAFANPIDRVRDTDSPVSRWVAATSPFRGPGSPPPPQQQAIERQTQSPVPPPSTAEQTRGGSWLGGIFGRASPGPAQNLAAMAQLTPLQLPPQTQAPRVSHAQTHYHAQPQAQVQAHPYAHAHPHPQQQVDSPIAKWVQDTRRANHSPAPGSMSKFDPGAY